MASRVRQWALTGNSSEAPESRWDSSREYVHRTQNTAAGVHSTMRVSRGGRGGFSEAIWGHVTEQDTYIRIVWLQISNHFSLRFSTDPGAGRDAINTILFLLDSQTLNQ